MPDLTATLHLVAANGYPLVVILLFLASAGLPLPVGVLLLTLGALTTQEGALSLPLLVLYGTLASTAGDLLPFTLGRLGGARLLTWLRRLRRGALAPALARADAQLQRHGAAMVFLSRFALTAFATPVSLLVGAARMRVRAFLAWDALGEAVFVVGTLALGRLFGAALAANDTLADALGFALALLALLPFFVRPALHLIARRRPHAQRAARPRLLPAPAVTDHPMSVGSPHAHAA
jgi:membrane protein DedA with SNARE-associated domain